MSKTDWLNLFPAAERCNLDYFIDGEEYFKELIMAFNSAKGKNHYIYILGWMLDLDFRFSIPRVSGYQTFRESLHAAAERQVEIRVLIWDNILYPGSTKIFRDGKHSLQKHDNVKIYIVHNKYSPKSTKILVKSIYDFAKDYTKGFKTRKYILKKWKGVEIRSYFEWVRNSNFSVAAHHEKIVVVNGSDGLVAYCGGFDINSNRIGTNHEPIKLHDVACKVNNEPANRLLEQFLQRWHDCPEKDNQNLRGKVVRPEQKRSTANTNKTKTRVQKVGTYNSAKKKDRSLSLAYFTIIENAKKFIYIEGQYATNIDIARLINKKLKEDEFELAFIATQDSSETLSDTLMPGELRSRFLDALYKDLAPGQSNKVLYTVINKLDNAYRKDTYHHAQHSKVIIADDEVAIVGSANANQRSFSVDSETSLVVIDPILVKKMRTDLWYHTVLNKDENRLAKKLIEHRLYVLPQAIRWHRKSRIKSYLRLYNYYPDVVDLNIQYKNSSIFDLVSTNTVVIKWLIYILLKSGFLSGDQSNSLISPPLLLKKSSYVLPNLRKRVAKLEGQGNFTEVQAEYAAINLASSSSQRPYHLKIIFLYLIEQIFDLRG